MKIEPVAEAPGLPECAAVESGAISTINIYSQYARARFLVRLCIDLFLSGRDAHLSAGGNGWRYGSVPAVPAWADLPDGTPRRSISIRPRAATCGAILCGCARISACSSASRGRPNFLRSVNNRGLHDCGLSAPPSWRPCIAALQAAISSGGPATPCVRRPRPGMRPSTLAIAHEACWRSSDIRLKHFSETRPGLDPGHSNTCGAT